MLNKYLAPQFSGTEVQLLINTICDEYNLPEAIANYFRNINIDNALADDLYNIGLWIGLPWPTADPIIFTDNVFTFGHVEDFPEYKPLTGFGSVFNPTIGGLFSSLNPAETERIPIDKYRVLLKAFAYAKYHGITLHTIDVLAKVFSDTYLIGFHDSWFLFGPGSEPTPDEFHGFSDDIADVGGALAPDVDTTVVDWDIDLIFLNDIGSGNLYVIQRVFDQLCTDVQVICSIDA